MVRHENVDRCVSTEFQCRHRMVCAAISISLVTLAGCVGASRTTAKSSVLADPCGVLRAGMSRSEVAFVLARCRPEHTYMWHCAYEEGADWRWKADGFLLKEEKRVLLVYFQNNSARSFRLLTLHDSVHRMKGEPVFDSKPQASISSTDLVYTGMALSSKDFDRLGLESLHARVFSRCKGTCGYNTHLAELLVRETVAKYPTKYPTKTQGGYVVVVLRDLPLRAGHLSGVKYILQLSKAGRTCKITSEGFSFDGGPGSLHPGQTEKDWEARRALRQAYRHRRVLKEAGYEYPDTFLQP